MDDLFNTNPENERSASPDTGDAEQFAPAAEEPSAAKESSADSLPIFDSVSKEQTPAPQNQSYAYDASAPQQIPYTAPQNTYSAPQNVYSAPQNVYSAPQNVYSTPQNVYAAPQRQAYTPTQPYTASPPYTAYNYGNTDSPYGAPSGYPYAAQAQTPAQSVFQAPPPIKSKAGKGHKTGATIFISAICLCVIVACILIATRFADNGPVTLNPTTQSSDNDDTSGGGNASVTIASTPTVTGSATGALTSSKVYDMVKNINVGVLVYSSNNLAGEGSGVVMGKDADGKYTYIITCAHVISDPGVSIRIRFSDNTDIEAVIVGYDTKTDIGVLKVKKTGLAVAEFGDIGQVAVGQTVYAIGNPGGTEFFGSFTKGMISAMDRPVDSSVGYSQPCIQHTAAINPGNSGGALVNEYGQVIGVNSSKIADTDYEGMGFSVPIDTVKKVVDEIIAHGYVTNRPKLGIKYSPVAQSQIYSIIVQSNNLPSGSIIIAEIDPDSDLSSKGVQVNDLIIKANGKDLTTTNTLPTMIDDMSVGETLTLTIVRVNNNYSIGKPFTVKVKLVEDRGSTITENETTTQNFFDPFG